MRRRAPNGFSLLEVVVVGALLGIMLTLVFTRWQAYATLQRLRYGIVQVATDLRQAEERAKSERLVYTVTFTAGSSTYTIARSGGGFGENAQLPTGVTASASQVVTFSAFGRPSSAYTIIVQNAAGTATATVNVFGGITYQEP